MLRCVKLRGLTVAQLSSPDIVDEDLNAREKALVWKQDLRIVPLCAAIYLLCYLDRSNIGIFPATRCRIELKLKHLGNAKILNSDTHNDLLSETNMTSYQYT